MTVKSAWLFESKKVSSGCVSFVRYFICSLIVYTHISLVKIRQLVQKKSGIQISVMPMQMLMYTGYAQRSIYSLSSEGRGQTADANM